MISCACSQLCMLCAAAHADFTTASSSHGSRRQGQAASGRGGGRRPAHQAGSGGRRRRRGAQRCGGACARSSQLHAAVAAATHDKGAAGDTQGVEPAGAVLEGLGGRRMPVWVRLPAPYACQSCHARMRLISRAAAAAAAAVLPPLLLCCRCCRHRATCIDWWPAPCTCMRARPWRSAHAPRAPRPPPCRLPGERQEGRPDPEDTGPPAAGQGQLSAPRRQRCRRRRRRGRRVARQAHRPPACGSPRLDAPVL